MIRYLTLEQILRIHQRVMERYGEGEQAGVMFKEKLVSAVLRPQQHHFGEELFPSLFEKAGALAQSLVQEHPFHNGNKRTAFAALQMFLYLNGYRLIIDPKEAEDMMVAFVTDKQFKGDDGARAIGKHLEKIIKSQE